MSNWIKCSERLPREGLIVICFLPKESGSWRQVMGSMHNNQWLLHESWNPSLDVTHWMPLPEPPNDEQLPPAETTPTTPNPRTYEKWNVIRNKATMHLKVVHKTFTDENGEFEFVSSTPHEDGDMSYTCGRDYCRCMQ